MQNKLLAKLDYPEENKCQYYIIDIRFSIMTASITEDGDKLRTSDKLSNHAIELRIKENTLKISFLNMVD